MLGSTTERMIVASRRSATATPKPICWNITSSPRAKPAKTTTIEAWVPIFLFCVLFGLSMDYHVFLLSRIRERYTQTGDSSEAVAFGVRTTARLITGAALIIIVVFVGFATGELVMFQQMGFGVAVALLLDATVIRSVLVPAAMELLGERNWYLPSWLEWIPRVRHDAPPEITRRG